MGTEQIDTGTDEEEAHLEENGVAVVRLNRPDRLHALTLTLMDGLESAIGMMKQAINRAISGDIDECLDWELMNSGACFKTADTKEAVRAFMEKRTPEFKGR